MKGFTDFYRYFKLRDLEHTLSDLASEFSSDQEVSKLLLEASQLLDDASIEYSRAHDCNEIFE